MLSCAGPQVNGEHILRQPSNLNTCSLPAVLPRARCFSGASIDPDNNSFNATKAGLGIKYFIKAQINQATSVLMTEAVTIALAARITSLLGIRDASFLTDSQLLVPFFNGSELCTPPRWDIKPFTQSFLNAVAGSNSKVFKIDRHLNTTAHLLANQAFRYSEPQCNHRTFSCTNANHDCSCPLIMALQNVPLDLYSLIAASYC